MTDLVKRLLGQIKWAADREDDFAVMIETDRKDAHALLSRIEELERELAEWRKQCLDAEYNEAELQRQLAAEKALADLIYEALYFDRVTDRQLAIRAYRKARGL